MWGSMTAGTRSSSLALRSMVNRCVRVTSASCWRNRRLPTAPGARLCDGPAPLPALPAIAPINAPPAASMAPPLRALCSVYDISVQLLSPTTRVRIPRQLGWPTP